MSRSFPYPIIDVLLFIFCGVALGSCNQTPAVTANNLAHGLPSKTASILTTKAPSTPTLQATALPTKVIAAETVIPDLESTLPTMVATALPPEHYIRNISGHRQYFAIGCEASAAVDWAAYFGIHINEFNFQYEIPLSDNPDYGFVGDVNGPWGQVPPYAYGVYAGPIATALQKHGLPAKSVKGFSVDQIRSEIVNDRPVITWVIGNMVGGVPALYIDSKGRKTVVAAYEHVVIVTGYNEKSIRYMNNGKFFEVPTDVFESSWNVLENMAVYWSK